MFIVEDGKAAVRRVKPGGESGTDIVVDQGLTGGEQVIVEGLQSLRPGVPVRAAPMPPIARTELSACFPPSSSTGRGSPSSSRS